MNSVVGNIMYVLRHVIDRKNVVVSDTFKVEYPVEKKLIAVSFQNTGANDAVLNGNISIPADGSMKTFSSEIGVYDTSRYELTFVGTGAKKVEVYQTFEIKSFVEQIVIPFAERVK